MLFASSPIHGQTEGLLSLSPPAKISCGSCLQHLKREERTPLVPRLLLFIQRLAISTHLNQPAHFVRKTSHTAGFEIV